MLRSLHLLGEVVMQVFRVHPILPVTSQKQIKYLAIFLYRLLKVKGDLMENLNIWLPEQWRRPWIEIPDGCVFWREKILGRWDEHRRRFCAPARHLP